MSHTKPLRIGWLTTANGEGSRGMFQAVLDAITSRRLNARFEFVFVNRDHGQTSPTDSFLRLVEKNHIPLVTLSSQKFRRRHDRRPWAELREDFDRAALKLLSRFHPDISMQAGYTLYAPILCQNLLMLNQHPALPGGTIGMWQDAVWDVIQSNASHTGSMVHISTTKLDRGPVVSLCRFPVRGNRFDHLWQEARKLDIPSLRQQKQQDLPLFKAIRNAGLLRERPLVVETLRAVSNREISLDQLRNPSPELQPLDLTEPVERAVAELHTEDS